MICGLSLLIRFSTGSPALHKVLNYQYYVQDYEDKEEEGAEWGVDLAI